MSESNKEEVKYIFLFPENLLGEKESEIKKEKTIRKEDLSFQKETFSISIEPITDEKLSIKKETKESIDYESKNRSLEEQSFQFIFKPQPDGGDQIINQKLKTIKQKEIKQDADKYSIATKKYYFQVLSNTLALIFILSSLILSFLILRISFQRFFINKEISQKEEINFSQQEVQPEMKQPEILLPQTSFNNEEINTSSQEISSEKQIPSERIEESLSKYSPIVFFNSREIDLFSTDYSEFTSRLKDFFIKQDLPGMIINLEIKINKQRAPLNFIIDYFLNPSFTNDKNELYNNLGERYNILLYYSLTRKNIILLLETKNPSRIEEFNKRWERESLIKDISPFFIDYPLGKVSKNFTFEKVNGIPVRIVYFDNNTHFFWLIYDKYVIYGTKKESLEKILENLPR